jgi:hypothetical protein
LKACDRRRSGCKGWNDATGFELDSQPVHLFKAIVQRSDVGTCIYEVDVEVLVIVLFKLFAIHNKRLHFKTIDVLFKLVSQLLRIESCFRSLDLVDVDISISVSFLVLLIDLGFNLISFLIIRDERLYFNS